MESHDAEHTDRDSLATSRSLLMRLKQNDDTAWNRLVDLYTPLVVYWCRRHGVSDQDISDVLQDIFRAVSRNIERFRKDRPSDTFRGWLRTITRSKVMDHFRRHQKQQHAAGGSVAMQQLSELPDPIDDEAGDEDSEDQTPYNSLFARALEMIRGNFEEQTWNAFWRVVVDGKSAADVAEELSMRPGTVRVAKSRVLQRLRAELGELLE